MNKTMTRFVSVVLMLVIVISIMVPVNAYSETTAMSVSDRKALSNGQRNIVKRAYQMTNIQWTPQADIIGWGNGLTYKAGKTYTGLPYGQPVNASYVPWSTSLEGFIEKVNDSNSKMYTSYSSYNKRAPYYSIDCSAFVSWAWGLSNRQTTSTIHNFATKISTSSYAEAEVGDCLCLKGSHVVLITDITYDEGGKINSIEISESTVNSATYYCCQKTRYGVGGSYTLGKLTQKYFESGYILYRSKTRDNVKYTHSCTVPLEGDICNHCGLGEIEEIPCEITVVAVEDVTLYDRPYNNATQIGTIYANNDISVVACWEDASRTLWYKTVDGEWVMANKTALICDHNYVYSVTQPPSCTEGGLGSYVCTLCMDSYSESIHPTGHSYVSVAISPDCENPGYTEHCCMFCHDYYVDEEISPVGHSFMNGFCVLCGEKDSNVIKGDVNGDREITSSDAVLLARFLVNLEELDAVQLLAADLNEDGEVTSADSVLLARLLAGL